MTERIAFPLRIGAGWVHTLVVSDEGKFYGFGVGRNGELGHSVGLTEFAASSVNLNFPTAKNPELTQIAVGAKHTLALIDGDVYSTGATDDGRLGHHTKHGQISFPGVDKIKFIACGSDSSLALSQDGKTVYAWGRGYSTTAMPEPITIRMPTSVELVMVACGTEHALALGADGSVFSWGSGRNGRLGHGSEADCKTPKLIEALVLSEEQKVIQVACGDAHNLALTAEGRVYAWGSGAYGRLGLGTEMDFHVPNMIDEPTTFAKSRVIYVGCGPFHSLAIVVPEEEDFSLYTWGGGKHGKLGHGDERNVFIPKPVEDFRKPTRIIRAVCGQHHTVALTSDNQLMAWGAATGSRCGVKVDSLAIYRPLKIKFFEDCRICTTIANELKELDQPREEGYRCRDIACGNRHTLALAVPDRAETMRTVILAWGSNNQGQLGVGSMSQTSRPLPVPIPSNDIINTVVCGDDFSMCLTESGTIFAWGANDRGQLGLGDTSRRNRPQVIKALQGTNIISLVAGANHVAAVAANPDERRQNVYVWGDNTYGQLGLGREPVCEVPCTPAYHAYPKPLQLGSVFGKKGQMDEQVIISLGTTHTLILVQLVAMGGVRDVRLFSCGTGKYGQLGSYANTQNAYPMPRLVEFKDIHPDDRAAAEANQKDRGEGVLYPAIRLIAASQRASIAISKPADFDIVYVWGQLPGLQDSNSEPTYVESLNNAAKLKAQIGSDVPISDFKIEQVVSANAHHFLVCKYNDKTSHGRAPIVFGWGETQYGQLGVGNVARHVEAKLAEDAEAKQNSEEDDAEEKKDEVKSAAVESEKLTAIGPELIKSFKSIRIKQFSARANHNAIVTEDGCAYTWGYGDSGRLGHGDGKARSSTSCDVPTALDMFDKERRQAENNARRANRKANEEKDQDPENPGSKAGQLLMQAQRLRKEFTNEFRIYRTSNMKKTLHKVQLIHAAILHRIDQSQGDVDSITSRRRIEENNREKKILKIRAKRAQMKRAEMLAEQERLEAEREKQMKMTLEERMQQRPKIDKPDSGSWRASCRLTAHDWNMDYDVESEGDDDAQDLAGFLEEKQQARLVSFERDLLNNAEIFVTRLYMQPCLMLRVYKIYANQVEIELQKHMQAKGDKEQKDDSEGLDESVAKVNALCEQFINLLMGVYDLHRQEDIQIFQVFLRKMLEMTTRGKTKNLILDETSLEWAVFREIFLTGRIRRQLADILAKALKELEAFHLSTKTEINHPQECFLAYPRTKDALLIQRGFQLIREKADQLLALLASYQYLPFIISTVSWPFVCLVSALRRNKIDPSEVVGRIFMRVLSDVMLEDQSYQFRLEERQRERRGMSFKKDGAQGGGEGGALAPQDDPHAMRHPGRPLDKRALSQSKICQGASRLGVGETFVLLHIRDIGSEIPPDAVTDLMLYITGQYKIPDYIMRAFGGLGTANGVTARQIWRPTHPLLNSAIEQIERIEQNESKGNSAAREQAQLDLLISFLKMSYIFDRRIVQIPRNSLVPLADASDLGISMKKVMKDLGLKLEEGIEHLRSDNTLVNVRLDPTRCDFDLRRKASDDACEVCRCMHPRSSAATSSAMQGDASNIRSVDKAKDNVLVFKKDECDLMYQVFQDPQIKGIIDDMDGEAAWLAIMAELKEWRQRMARRDGERDAGHQYEVASYAFKRLMRLQKGTRIELGEKYDLVQFGADSTSVDPVFLRQRLIDRQIQKSQYQAEEQRKVNALNALLQELREKNQQCTKLYKIMEQDFNLVKSATVIDGTHVAAQFSLDNKNTNPRDLRKFSDRLRSWDKIRVVSERGQILYLTYAELVSQGILYRVRPLRKFLPCLPFCCLQMFAVCHCFDEEGRALIDFLSRLVFIFSTTSNPDIIHMKMGFRTEKKPENDLIMLRSTMFSLKELMSKDCKSHKFKYDPLGDDVPLTREVVFQFSKTRLGRLLRQFPRNMKDEGAVEEEEINDVL